MQINDGLSNLMAAKRLIQYAQRMEDKRLGKKVDEKTAKEEMEEDQFLLSGTETTNVSYGPGSGQPVEDTQINLSELIARGKAASEGPQPAATQTVQLEYKQVIERSASLRYQALEQVDGLVRRSESLAETDRYRFDFSSDGSTFKITDKWANRSTTIWGDPHVDVDDVDGNNNGDFQDLKTSDMNTTFMLQDGTQVTFTAKDTGIIETVDIFKGGQHLRGIGSGSSHSIAKTAQFSGPVDKSTSSFLPKGDTVYAGGDGNDWFASGGKLVWGKTTGAVVNDRPLAILQLEYHQSISEQLSLTVVNKQA